MRERKSELRVTVFVIFAILASGIALIALGSFDADGIPKLGAVQSFSAMATALVALALGYAGARTARKFSSDKVEPLFQPPPMARRPPAQTESRPPDTGPKTRTFGAMSGAPKTTPPEESGDA